MTDSVINRGDFTIPRTPAQLAAYVSETYQAIASVRELLQSARLRKGPYKTFIEELMPFSHFCTWRYGERNDVLCSLVSDTPTHDAIVTLCDTGIAHSVEITWPIDGKHMIHEAREMNENGFTQVKIWDYHDTTMQEDAVKRILEIARKKGLRDYRRQGGSTIIFVMDCSDFWSSNSLHMKILDSLRCELAKMNLLSDNVLLMLVMGEEKQIIQLKGIDPE
jgi:hypothetical protein